MDIFTLIVIIALIGIDIIAVYYIMRLGLKHEGLHEPLKPDESVAVQRLRKLNAERLEKIEAARAKAALPAGGEPAPEA
ncbi:MAG: hypothetical protein IPM16_23265 [Chloroflexi bacterium]|nr:hypothetical protein [Chloroflexota bacterium]